jgi:hypothetical protein
MALKRFTVDEANRLIPILEVVFAEISRRVEGVRQAADRLQVLDVLWGQKVLEESNPDFAEGESFREAMPALMNEIEALVEEEIHNRGLRFPYGGLESGLIDFPSTWEGRWVYLCWQRGEPAIAAWHEIDGGFAGRQDLTVEQIRLMGVEEVPGWLDPNQ